MKKILGGIVVGLSLLVLAGNAPAASITMSGDYVLTAVGGNGTLGAGYDTYPGIRHDPAGTGSFPTEDYLSPGDPWEMFSVSSSETGLKVNNNTYSDVGDMAMVSLTDLSVSSVYDQFVRWDGTVGGSFDIRHDTFFNDGDERINIKTTITALSDLSNLKFARALDPDPDVYSGGSFDTINGRGSLGLAPEDWVHSEGPDTGLTIGLYSNSAVTHNTAVTDWTSDPDTYLAGVTACSSCDYTIGIGFDIGTLLTGSSISFEYDYVMGGSLDTVDIPSVPEPSTYLLLGSGIAGLALWRRKRKLKG